MKLKILTYSMILAPAFVNASEVTDWSCSRISNWSGQPTSVRLQKDQSGYSMYISYEFPLNMMEKL